MIEPELSADDVLVMARRLIRHRRNWIKNVSYQPATDYTSECWCASGAVEEAGKRLVGSVDPLLRNRLVRDAMVRLASKVPKTQFNIRHSPVGQVVDFNDDPETWHKDVLEAFDAAIEVRTPRYGSKRPRVWY